VSFQPDLLVPPPRPVRPSSPRHAKGGFPLHAAAEAGNSELLALLLDKHTGEENAMPAKRSGLGAGGGAPAAEPPIPLPSASMIEAANLVDPRGETLLLAAIPRDDTATLQLLLGRGADPSAVEPHDQSTPLHLACEHRSQHALRLLLAVSGEKSSEKVPRVVEISRELGRGINLEATDVAGDTPLGSAAAAGWLHGVRALLRAGADPRGGRRGDAPSSAGGSSGVRRTPFERAAAGGHWAVAELLADMHAAIREDRLEEVLECVRGGFGLSTVDSRGDSVLHASLRSGRGEIFKVLLEAGAEVTARDRSGRTALHVAAELDAVDETRLLLAKGAPDVPAGLPDLHHDGGQQDPWTSTGGGSRASGGGSNNNDDGDDGDDGDADDDDSDDGNYDDHDDNGAAGKDHGRKSAKSASSSRRKNMRRRTAVHVAARHGSTGALKLLLGAGHAANARDAQSDTPLHLAARANHASAVSALLDAGGDPGARGHLSMTPARAAERVGNKDLAQLIARAEQAGGGGGGKHQGDREGRGSGSSGGGAQHGGSDSMHERLHMSIREVGESMRTEETGEKSGSTAGGAREKEQGRLPQPLTPLGAGGAGTGTAATSNLDSGLLVRDDVLVTIADIANVPVEDALVAGDADEASAAVSASMPAGAVGGASDSSAGAMTAAAQRRALAAAHPLETPTHHAVRLRDTVALKHAVDARLPLAPLTPAGYSPLHVAAALGAIDPAVILLSSGNVDPSPAPPLRAAGEDDPGATSATIASPARGGNAMPRSRPGLAAPGNDPAPKVKLVPSFPPPTPLHLAAARGLAGLVGLMGRAVIKRYGVPPPPEKGTYFVNCLCAVFFFFLGGGWSGMIR
jgi:ankyrin repeat protein